MRPDTSYVSYLWDMLDAASAIRQFIDGKTFKDYSNDRLLRGAFERHIEIIGEAARNVFKEFRQNQPDIPWSKIIAQRRVLAHEYGEIKHERIWAVATTHLTGLIDKIKPLVPEPPK